MAKIGKKRVQDFIDKMPTTPLQEGEMRWILTMRVSDFKYPIPENAKIVNCTICNELVLLSRSAQAQIDKLFPKCNVCGADVMDEVRARVALGLPPAAGMRVLPGVSAEFEKLSEGDD